MDSTQSDHPDGQSKGNLKIDVHMHLAGSGCGRSGCWIHKDLKKRYTIKILQFFHRISNEQMETNLDQLWGEKISKVVEESPLDYGVALGFDGATDSQGERDLSKSQLIVPPEWVFKLCEDYPNLLPGPSVNPHLKDAEETLHRCIEQKAVLIKWLPSAQLINPSSGTIKGFYRLLAQSGIPLLIHCGGEKTFKSLDPSLNQVQHLLAPLEEGVKVICAHSATRVIGSDEEDQRPLLKEYLRRFPNLWVDNSGLCNPSRFSHVPELASDPLINSRTLYGSDWPVPSNAFYYLRDMGLRKVYQLEREANWLKRDVAIKEFYGYGPDTLTRASEVLANVSWWTNRNRQP